MLLLNAHVICLGMLCCGVVGGGYRSVDLMNDVRGVQLVARPLDVPSEKLERPRPEQDRMGSSEAKARLSYGEVVGLAKTAAKKELGKQFDEVEVKSVVFEPGTGLWSVIFDPKPPRRPSDGCLIVFVYDKDKTTNLQPCH